MPPLVRSILYAVLTLSIISCTVLEKTPISIEEAVGVGAVQVTTGTPVSLEESIYVSDKLWVVFHSDSAVLYDNISSFEDHYFGVIDSRMDSLNERIIKVIFPEKTLTSIVFKEIVQIGEMKFIGVKSYERTEICVECIFAIKNVDKIRNALVQIARLLIFLLIVVGIPILYILSSGIPI